MFSSRGALRTKFHHDRTLWLWLDGPRLLSHPWRARGLGDWCGSGLQSPAKTQRWAFRLRSSFGLWASSQRHQWIYTGPNRQLQQLLRQSSWGLSALEDQSSRTLVPWVYNQGTGRPNSSPYSQDLAEILTSQQVYCLSILRQPAPASSSWLHRAVSAFLQSSMSAE